MDLQQAKRVLSRRAIRLTVGGIRPPEAPAASWFGRVNLGLPGETWPTANGKPLCALCQLNLTEMPFRPPRLDDVEFITVFVDPDNLPFRTPNGSNWVLRAYKTLAGLAPLSPADADSPIRPFPLTPAVIDEDYPCEEEVEDEDARAALEDEGVELANVSGTKLGGWPTLIQSEIFWGPHNQHPAKPEYVFQIDSEAKARWQWGDSGVAHFGRGTAPGSEDEWVIEIQMM